MVSDRPRAVSGVRAQRTLHVRVHQPATNGKFVLTAYASSTLCLLRCRQVLKTISTIVLRIEATIPPIATRYHLNSLFFSLCSTLIDRPSAFENTFKSAFAVMRNTTSSSSPGLSRVYTKRFEVVSLPCSVIAPNSRVGFVLWLVERMRRSSADETNSKRTGNSLSGREPEFQTRTRAA